MCENGEIFFRKRDNRPTFVENCAILPLANTEEAWRTRANFMLEPRSLYYRSPDGAAAEQTRCYGERRNSSRLVV